MLRTADHDRQDRASVPVAIATLVYEKRLPARGGQPMLDLTLFQNRAYSVGISVIRR